MLLNAAGSGISVGFVGCFVHRFGARMELTGSALVIGAQ